MSPPRHPLSPGRHARRPRCLAEGTRRGGGGGVARGQGDRRVPGSAAGSPSAASSPAPFRLPPAGAGPRRRLRKASSRGRHSSCGSDLEAPGREWVGARGVGREGEWGEGRCVRGGGLRGAGPCAADVPSSAGKYRLCCHAGVSLMKIGIR